MPSYCLLGKPIKQKKKRKTPSCSVASVGGAEFQGTEGGRIIRGEKNAVNTQLTHMFGQSTASV